MTGRWKRWVCGLGLLAAAGALSAGRGFASSNTTRAPAESADVAVIVNARTPVDSLSMAELRKIAMGDRQFWTGSQRIAVLIRAPVSHERDVLLKKVYQMSETQYKQYWIAKVFRAEAQAAPKVVYSNQTALQLVDSLPGAIAFVDADQIPKGAKVVKINGHAPDEKGYPLQ